MAEQYMSELGSSYADKSTNIGYNENTVVDRKMLIYYLVSGVQKTHLMLSNKVNFFRCWIDEFKDCVYPSMISLGIMMWIVGYVNMIKTLYFPRIQ